jgi:DNA helicase-2/ATP-dependent DNA helicase PcrA
MEADFHGVKLLTAHQSKGLEFEYVFIVHLTDNHWGNKSARKLIKLPSGLMKIQDSVADADEEERRLFYVALTRAKKEIFLSYADHYNDSTSATMPSKFLAEIDPEFLTIINEKEYEEKYIQRLEISLSPIVLAPSKDIEKYMNELAQQFVLSVTSFNTYLECPQKFFYNQFLHVPKVKDFTIAYGSSVHYALEHFFKKQINDSQLPDKNYLFDCFEEGLDREILIEADIKRALHLGKKILDEYYDFYQKDWLVKNPVACEFNFKPHNVHFGSIAITGKIDKVELIDEASKQVRIIDYKTSSPKSQNYLLGQTKEADLTYVYQAYFYKLLAENDSDFDWQIAEIEFDFISPTNGKFTKVNIPIDQKAYEEFTKKVKEVHQDILDLKFMPDKTACKSSRFECDYIDLC